MSHNGYIKLDTLFAKFECTDSNVQKTSFPFSLPYKWHRWPPESIDVKFDPPLSFLPQSLYNQGYMDWHSLLQIYEIFLNDI